MGPPPKKSAAFLISFLTLGAGDFPPFINLPPFFGGVALTFFFGVSPSESEDISCDPLHYCGEDLHTRVQYGPPSFPLHLPPFCLLPGSCFSPCTNTWFEIILVINYHWGLKNSHIQVNTVEIANFSIWYLGLQKVSCLSRCLHFLIRGVTLVL